MNSALMRLRWKVLLLPLLVVAGEATPPDFGPNVLIFDPTTPDLQQRIDAVYTMQERSEFGPGRFALLFRPGRYEVDVRVGFCTQVAGLGRQPDDVAITGAVRSKTDWRKDRHALVNFWRCAENLAITPTTDGHVAVWAVSQATALRRVHVRGDLSLWEIGYSSGGFMADCVVDGLVNSGTQQQWLSRNTRWDRWTGSNWNMVFVGVVNAPAETWPSPPYTVVPRTPRSQEKPYLFLDRPDHYAVFVPDYSPGASSGPTWESRPTPGRVLPIEGFHLARPESDNSATLNAALGHGLNLLFTPGIYHLDSALQVTRPGTVVLGLGYPTLIPDRGTAALTVADVDGVKLAGLLLEAGPVESPVLLQVGEPGSGASHASDPTCLFDIFCRAGGAVAGSTRTFVELNSADVIGDNFWLWRADHGRGAAWDQNRVARGLVVNGRNVTLYGLFVEHTQEYQTLWNGENGRVFFYQSELPYDPPAQAAWMCGDQRGYASYKVADHVRTHEAWGLGIYAVLKQSPVVLDSAIECPDTPGIRFHHMVMYRLNKPGSGIAHVINDVGDPVITGRGSRVDEWPLSAH